MYAQFYSHNNSTATQFTFVSVLQITTNEAIHIHGATNCFNLPNSPLFAVSYPSKLKYASSASTSEDKNFELESKLLGPSNTSKHKTKQIDLAWATPNQASSVPSAASASSTAQQMVSAIQAAITTDQANIAEMQHELIRLTPSLPSKKLIKIVSSDDESSGEIESETRKRAEELEQRLGRLESNQEAMMAMLAQILTKLGDSPSQDKVRWVTIFVQILLIDGTRTCSNYFVFPRNQQSRRWAQQTLILDSIY